MTVNHMFTQKVAKVDRGMLASYKIANLIAKAGKPHTIGESLIMPAVAVVLSTVMNQSPQEVTSVIPLSNSSVSRRIDEMASDVENQLISKLQVNDFSLQLDESTLPDNSALLMAFVRFLDVDEICQEMLFALKLTTDTLGESIFKKLEVYFEENNIPLKNIVACATDGAAAMNRKTRVAQFPSLAVISTDLLDDDLAVYVDHLKQLHNDMDTRFSDLLQMTVPHWFVDPFIADVSEVDVTLQESLIELQNTQQLKQGSSVEDTRSCG
ncbi:zinc finger MYM-type protein 6-like [Macrobrachium nipponense]|uniref:zinc finger MYM-type protein 6-like n=1 Tax=Macrobrachium nipponense TaxID=159736 RepID=UPI0030C88730